MRAVVVASGAVSAADAELLAGADLVIAADGGATTLDRLGRRPDVLVGDLDSVRPALVDRLAAAGTRVERHPADKDASDTELAIETALAAGATSTILLGATGGARLDHELANLLLLVDPRLGRGDLAVVHDATLVRGLLPGAPLTLRAGPGDTVSLLPVGGDASGVTTSGLRWELAEAQLRLGRSRGLSNVVVAAPASVRIAGGALLVIETTARKDPS